MNREALRGESHCLGSAPAQRAASQDPGQWCQSPQKPNAGSPDSSHCVTWGADTRTLGGTLGTQGMGVMGDEGPI